MRALPSPAVAQETDPSVPSVTGSSALFSFGNRVLDALPQLDLADIEHYHAGRHASRRR